MTFRSILLVAALVVAAPLAAAHAESGRWGSGYGTARPAAQATAAVQRRDTTADPVRKRGQAPAEEKIDVLNAGNSGELRSEVRPQGLFDGLFGAKPQMLPETRALDGALASRSQKKLFKVKDDFQPRTVEFSGYPRGTIVVDTAGRYLYLVETHKTARRYAIAVGREGLAFTGTAKVGDKQEWPRWIPTKDMQEREPKKYGQYKDGMNGGPDNPLGARAIYLYQGKRDTHIRIHGTNQPETIGTASSNGCFRMVNEHVMDLYNRVRIGTDVVVVNGLSS
ncbi:MAG: L,D-transpeptidase [Rhizobiaceae bacterium]|nr:L,D-transpeptidase [Rhizobiaceae bacterium]MCV0406449.1 L,D-transpeptidase [Rhizobiaceae bacterium]